MESREIIIVRQCLSTLEKIDELCLELEKKQEWRMLMDAEAIKSSLRRLMHVDTEEEE